MIRQRWRRWGYWDQLNIKDPKIIHKYARYACKKLNLKIFSQIKDRIGTRSYVLEDKQNRKYFFVCKRYVAIINNEPTVSINEGIILDCRNWNYFIILFIEKGGYLYTFDPVDIIMHSWPNQFNMQNMLNFSIRLAKNLELTRTRKKRPVEQSALVKYITTK